MTAYEEFMDFLLPDEEVEGIMFGPWSYTPYSKEDWRFVCDVIPKNKINKVLTFEEAKEYMTGWSFICDYGITTTYPIYAWTNERIIFLTRYDGATALAGAPRNPGRVSKYEPFMFGGG